MVPPVHVNQFGYTPAEAKWVAVGAAAPSFEVRRVPDGSVVLSGPLNLRRAADPASGDDVYSGNFSALATPGQYCIHVPGVGDSPDFLVHDAVYDELYRRFLKGLYYQRCGTAITAAHGGDWVHGTCHDHGTGIASYDWATTGGSPGGYRNTIGGWHDAGDYGKYSTNNAYAVGILLQAYELYPAQFAYDDCDIPESGNGTPDLLDEARWSLAWMLTMQDGSGAVRHRESIANYAGDFVPENDLIRRYYTSPSSDATAVHAAAMALAARLYAPFDAGFAAACSTSAVSAWNWLAANAARVPAGGFANLYGHTGATYIDGLEAARRLWAAAEIHRLNGSAAARSYVDAHWGEGKDFNGIWYPDSWADVANMGAFTYRHSPGATASIVSGSWWSVENSLNSSCGNWTARVAADGYGCVASADPPNGDYYWGFTGVILRYAWTLLEGYRDTGTAAWREAAREQLHYILGRNPLGKVFITGVGDRPVLHAHGAWNLAAGYTNVDDALCRPVPGLLVGGTNRADNPLSPYPGRCYEDIADPDYFYKGNYTLNETSVNIQAALIVLAGVFGTGGAVSGVPVTPPPPATVRIETWPNPFRESVSLRWTGGAPDCDPSHEAVAIDIFDVAGRRVRRLTASAPGTTSAFEASWDGSLPSGAPAPPGVYFARLASGAGTSRRIVRLR